MSTKRSKLIRFFQTHSATLGIILATISVSTASIFIRAAQENLPSLMIATYRMVLAALILLPFSLGRVIAERVRLNGKNIIYLVAAGVLLALHFISWITSLEYTKVISSVVLVTTTPIWVTLFSPLFLNERFSKSFMAGLIVAFAGIVVISAGSLCTLSGQGFACQNFSGFWQSENLRGNLLALLGAFCAAGYMIFGRKIRADLSNLSYVFLVYAIAGICLPCIAIITRIPLLNVGRQDAIWLVLLALIPQVMGHSLFNWALGKLPAAYVTLALLGEPVGSAVLALVFLREKPSALEYLGCVIIIFGIYWATKSRGKTKADPLKT